MQTLNSKEVRETLQKPDIHNQWLTSYVNNENEYFFNQAFAYILKVLNPPPKAKFLDAGCGNGTHSIRLARHGHSIMAVDFSEHILQTAELNIKSSGQNGNIKLKSDNILSLSFPDETFDYIICWGVLMHIPEIEKALAELYRVLKNGGALVISEANMYSAQAMVLRCVRRLLGKAKKTVRKTKAGLEDWTSSPAGMLLTRQTDIGWLMESLQNYGFTVKKRVAGQFTELYLKCPSRIIRQLIHFFNDFWFRYIKNPHLAFGNILFLEKSKMS